MVGDKPSKGGIRSQSWYKDINVVNRHLKQVRYIKVCNKPFIVGVKLKVGNKTFKVGNRPSK